LRLRLNDSVRERQRRSEQRASTLSIPPSKPLSSCSETVVFSPLGLILNKINSHLSSRSNHKPDLCLVSQARLALEEGEVRRLPSTRFASFKHILFHCCSGFGSSGGFGQNPQQQPQQPQQPQQANAMFGNIASNPNPTPATGASTFGWSLSSAFFFLSTSHQGHLGAIIIIHLVTQSPPLGLARLGVEGHPPLARVAEHSVRRLHLSRLRQTQGCLGRQIPLGARLGLVLVLLVTSPQQARSDRRVVCLRRNFLYVDTNLLCPL